MAENIATVRSLFVPVEHSVLLLPGTVVAEVVPFTEPAPPQESGAPEWYLGSVLWREQRIPLVSVDTLMTGEYTAPGSRARIAVLKALGNREEMPYYGIVTKQIPRLVTVYGESLEILEEGAAGLTGVAAEVLANGEPAIIPDLDTVEDLLFGYLNP